MSRVYGYSRVSSSQQKLDRQFKALKDYGVAEENIVCDKASGKDFNREQYQMMKKHMLRSGDVLVIKELDRLGRNKTMIKEELNYFKEHGIRVKVLNVPTTLMDIPEGQEWLLDMINNILIEVMGAIAENERVKIKTRQAEGIAAAKERGQHMGRPKLEVPELFEECYAKVKAGEITATKCIELLNISRGSYYKLVKQYEAR